MKLFVAVAASALLMAGVMGVGRAAPSTAPGATDDAGHIHVPEGYERLYRFLGSWAVANDSGPGAKQMHNVYASPGAIEAYKKDGHFPNGTVLVKEVYSTSTGPMTTGTVSRAQTLKGWFVMVRDTNASHPGNKLWGDGWGWSWFDAGNPSKTTSTDYKTDCQGCHVPAKSTDWIYTQGYPALTADSH